jgi:hypothetical protein
MSETRKNQSLQSQLPHQISSEIQKKPDEYNENKKTYSNPNVRINCLNVDLKIYSYTCRLLLKYQRIIIIIIYNRIIKAILLYTVYFFLILNICFLDEKLLHVIEDTISIHLYILIYIHIH